MVGGMKSLNILYLKKLDIVIKNINKNREEKYQIDESHGLHHGLIVLCNVSKALEEVNNSLGMNKREKILVKLAALLHDIDDHKYFPDNHKFENAREILNTPEIKEIDNLTENDISSILLMIYLVSSSTHGDTMPVGLPEWYFYPRYADRLEALGIIGIERTLEYTIKKGQPIFKTSTKRGLSKENLYENIATEERYKTYSQSVSMMDHFYDKLLRLGNYPISNKYFEKECELRISPLVDFCLKFSEKYPDGELNTISLMTTDTEKLDKFIAFVKEFINNCSPSMIHSNCEHQADEYLKEIRS
jgi:uncharacterized protein